jgi:signal transduction histidine kinase
MSAFKLPVPGFLLRRPSRTIRLRLTIIYASCFLASGIGLLATTYVLVRQATGDVIVGKRADGRSFAIREVKGNVSVPKGKATFENHLSGSSGAIPPLTPQQLQVQLERDQALAQRQHDAELRSLVEQSGIALAIMAALSIGIGWLAAGRALRPLRLLNEHARAISASNLHKRLALTGPDDELTQLADTFDELLGRLDASFQAQRQFVANASHELRTPLARARAIAEVALADPNATVESLRKSHERVLAAGRQQERLIEALLTLARSERGLDQRDAFDLAALAAAALQARREEAERRGLDVHATLEPAETSGDSPLAERLVANLIDNALRYNVPDGHIDVATGTRNGHAVLSVSNTGPPVPAGELKRLFQPFQRLGAERIDHGDGLGLGLSIVAAIATSHGATLTPRAPRAGGLEIEISFPLAGEPAVTGP